MASFVSRVPAAAQHLIAWLKTAALTFASLRLLVMRPVLHIVNMLRGFKKKQPTHGPLVLSLGSAGIVYQLSDAIAVKKRLAEDEDEGELINEQNVFAEMKSQPLSPYIVHHFYNTEVAIFMEYMPGGCLAQLLHDRLIREDGPFSKVLGVKLLTAERDCLRWMRQISAAAAWIEELGLAHGDIRPANILLSSAFNVKLADFGRTRKIGTLQLLTEPYARPLALDPKLLDEEEYEEQKRTGYTHGRVGCRTEQFAIGSVLYVLTRGYEPYETEDRGTDCYIIMMDKLRDMKFPVLRSRDKFDDIIGNCWHGRYESIAQLSRLLAGMDQYSSDVIEDQPLSAAELELRKRECMDMVQSGIIEKLFDPFKQQKTLSA
ncbi:hypothetical protein E4U21_006419 [Claviceps maximensis]|nr:hypothetical protein E4U21_006419 [Claviceps maximensis]